MSFAGSISGAGNTAHGAIVIDTQSLRDAARAARQAASEIESALNNTGQSAQRAQREVGLMGQAARAAGALISIHLVRSAASAAMEMARVSAVAAGMQQEFRNLTGVSELAAAGMLEAMRKASWGLINDFELIAAANRAFLFGVADDTDDMVQLLEIATARAAGMGISTEEALQRLVHGLGTLQPEVLRNLGFAINLNDVYEQYARTTGRVVSELSEMEKRQAVLNVLYEQSAEQIERMNDAGGTNAGTLERAKTAADNARLAFGALIEDDVVNATLRYAQAIERLTAALEAARNVGGGLSLSELAQMGQHALPPHVRPIVDFITRPAETEQGRATQELESQQRALEELQTTRDNLIALSDTPFASPAMLDMTNRQIEEITESMRRLRIEADSRIGSRGPPLASVSGAVAAATAGGGTAGGGFSDEVLAAQVDYWRGIEEIDRTAHAAIQDATEQYGQQRASTIAQYEKSMAREAEDFARQRARSVAAHERMIADIRQAAAEREVQWAQDLQDRIAGMRQDAALRNADTQADFDERITTLREDGAERLLELEESTRQARERAERQHRDTLLNAASRLDARAVAQEQRRWATAGAEQEEALQERLDEERENLEERIAQEQETHDKRMQREARDLQRRIDQEQAAHAERIADARAADEQRIIDQQEAFDEQIAQEDEDRAIRLGRQQQDHSDQLDEMARAQGLRIQQIREQQAEQRTKLNDAFQDQLDDLGLYNVAWRAKQREEQDKATELFEDMWDDWRTTMVDAWEAVRDASTAPTQASPFPEMMPDAGMGGYTPPSSTRSTTTSRTINIAPGAIVVNESKTPEATAEAVIRLLERAAE